MRLACIGVLCVVAATAVRGQDLRSALLLHASFDETADADTASGDKRLHTVVSRTEILPGVHREDVKLVEGGRFGRAIRFGERGANLFYPAAKNAGFRGKDWSGTVSVWLRVDPDQDLSGYADPVQIGDKGPLDEGIFIEFTKDAPRKFRLAVCPRKSDWNAANRKWEEIAVAERPIVQVDAPPFGRERWTHVVFTWERFNTGERDGTAKLYLDGELAGTIDNWLQNYAWDEAKARIVIGAGYVGDIDDLSIFSRALTAAEVKQVHESPGGVKALR